METASKVTTNRSYEDFDPVSKWRREDARDTVELYLPGFKREQVRIQVNHVGFMVISGERPLDGTRWKRFKKEIELPMYCNVDSIHGNFMQNILTVVMPKKPPPPPSHLHQEKQDKEAISPTTSGLEPETTKKNKGKKKVTYGENVEFGGGDDAIEEEEITETNAKRASLIVENDDELLLTPETTREVALKFMIVIFVILVIASYLADMSKSLMAHAQSYFHDHN